MIRKTFIVERKGYCWCSFWHKLCNLTQNFKSNIYVICGEQSADAKSIMDLIDLTTKIYISENLDEEPNPLDFETMKKIFDKADYFYDSMEVEITFDGIDEIEAYNAVKKFIQEFK